MAKVKPQRVTVIVEDAEISWDEVREAIRVKQDDSMIEAPWDNDDGWTHDADSIPSYSPIEDRENSIRYVSRSSHEGGSVWLTLDIKKSGICTWKYFHSQGASKQVAHELAAMALRQAYDQLHTWYANGWEWYVVGGELKECSAYVGGVDGLDYAKGECTDDMASQLAGELKQQVISSRVNLLLSPIVPNGQIISIASACILLTSPSASLPRVSLPMPWLVRA